MRCPKCGNEIDEGSVFCKHCGNRIGEKTDNSPGTGAATSLVSDMSIISKYKKPIIAVVAIVIVVFLAKTIFGGSGNSSYKDVVENYINSMKKCDVQGVLDCLPASEQNNYETIDLVTRELVGNGSQIGIVDSPYEVMYQVGTAEEMTKEELESFSTDGEKVKEGYKVTVNVTQNLDGITIEGMPIGGYEVKSKDYTMYVGKIGKKWYVLRYMEFTYYT